MLLDEVRSKLKELETHYNELTTIKERYQVEQADSSMVLAVDESIKKTLDKIEDLRELELELLNS